MNPSIPVNAIEEARKRIEIKRALRLAGVEIPPAIMFNLAALRKLHAKHIGRGGK